MFCFVNFIYLFFPKEWIAGDLGQRACNIVWLSGTVSLNQQIVDFYQEDGPEGVLQLQGDNTA